MITLFPWNETILHNHQKKIIITTIVVYEMEGQLSLRQLGILL